MDQLCSCSISGSAVHLQAIVRLLAEHGRPVAAVVGRFYGVYNRNRRAYLWDEAVSGGIIVQQVIMPSWTRACKRAHMHLQIPTNDESFW